MQDYERLGFPGTLCSVDATHVTLHACADSNLVRSTGKSGEPTRVFQICVRFARRIISTTTGHFGSWNDKTVYKYDKFLTDLEQNKIGADVSWNTYDEDGDSVENIGFLHAICDGGYPSYGNLVCAKSGASDLDIREWNMRVGQIRKDVECCLGSLKKRFRILKNGWRSKSMEMLDATWFTCCALHNLLLDFDAVDTDEFDELHEYMPSSSSSVNPSEGQADVMGELVGPINNRTMTRDSLEVRRKKMVVHYTEIRARNEVQWVAANGDRNFETICLLSTGCLINYRIHRI